MNVTFPTFDSYKIVVITYGSKKELTMSLFHLIERKYHETGPNKRISCRTNIQASMSVVN